MLFWAKRPHAKFCTDRCRNYWHGDPHIVLIRVRAGKRTCQWPPCASPLNGKLRVARYCTDVCRSRHAWERKKAANWWLWLDGPMVIRWLKSQQLHPITGDRRIEEALHRWRKGGRASFRLVDELLTRLGRHVSEVPDDHFVPREKVARKAHNALDR